MTINVCSADLWSMNNNDLSRLVFLDIETVSAYSTWHELPERIRKLWARKAGYLRRNPDDSDEVIYKSSAAIHAEFGKVIVVAAGRLYPRGSTEVFLDTTVFAGHNEYQLLRDVACWLNALPSDIRLCAHNGKEFDFPYLARRMVVHGIGLPELLNHSGKKPWEVPHLDTLELWKFGDHKHYTSLELLAALFGIESSKQDMDGSKVGAVYYINDDLPRIARYCAADVGTLAQVFLRLKAITRELTIHTTVHAETRLCLEESALTE